MKLPDVPDGFDVVAFDFDGTCATKTWPSPRLGDPIPEALEAIRYYNLKKRCQVVIFTARPASHIPRIWEWVHRHNLQYYIYEVSNTKPVAGLYFDDHAVRPSWAM